MPYGNYSKTSRFSWPFVSGFSAEDCKMDMYVSFDCPNNKIKEMEINRHKHLLFLFM